MTACPGAALSAPRPPTTSRCHLFDQQSGDAALLSDLLCQLGNDFLVSPFLEIEGRLELLGATLRLLGPVSARGQVKVEDLKGLLKHDRLVDLLGGRLWFILRSTSGRPPV